MTELLRKSGIIDKHVKEFEKWRLIDPREENDKSAELMVEDLLDEIAALLDKEPTMRQTLPAPIYTKTPPRVWCVSSIDERGIDSDFHAVKDEMGRLVVDGKTKICRGDTIWCEDAVHDNFTVTEVEDLYENDKVVAKMITIEKD
jgi:hypothetical protein